MPYPRPVFTLTATSGARSPAGVGVGGLLILPCMLMMGRVVGGTGLEPTKKWPPLIAARLGGRTETEMFYQHNMGAGGWIFMALGNIVIWGLIIAFILWLAQDLRSRPHRHHITSGASAGEILDRRLATGELNADEYKRLRNTLASEPNGQPPRIRETTGAPR